MCRFLAYIGKDILLNELVIKPKNSLVKQSVKAREAEEPLNGDGFGIGWYDHKIDPTPALFTSIRPAWNDRNLIYLANKIHSNCIFAHVRAATEGGVSETNCHPFHYKNFLFMHNGNIGGFNVIKRYLRRDLSDNIYDWVKGQTDSEHLFAIFLDLFEKKKAKHTAEDMAFILEEAIRLIEKVKLKFGVTEPSYINATVSEGKQLVAIRWVTDASLTPSTLYYSEGSKYECVDGVCKMNTEHNNEHSVLVVSEKLTSSRSDWNEIPPNHMLLINEDLSLKSRPCNI